MDWDDTKAAIPVVMTVEINGVRYHAKGKLVMCPFCLNKDPDKQACGLCEGAGIFMKLVRLVKLNLRVIKGGKGETLQ